MEGFCAMVLNWVRPPGGGSAAGVGKWSCRGGRRVRPSGAGAPGLSGKSAACFREKCCIFSVKALALFCGSPAVSRLARRLQKYEIPPKRATCGARVLCFGSDLLGGHAEVAVEGEQGDEAFAAAVLELGAPFVGYHSLQHRHPKRYHSRRLGAWGGDCY